MQTSDGYRNRVVREINTALDALAEDSLPWVARWVAHSVVGNHTNELPEGADTSFWEWNTYANIREMVRRQINARAGDTAERPMVGQLALLGFERDHLQYYYMVERDGVDQGVPITTMTDGEIEAKARFYRNMGAACYAHADELDRFRVWRGGGVAA